METRINTRIEFIQRYWKYYLLLEQDFLSVERYLTIDNLNFGAFSNEYIKQYQAICSEIDVIAKSYCRELDKSFKGEGIQYYCKCIIDKEPDFSTRNIRLNDRNLTLSPWKDWNYQVEQKDGKSLIVANSPKWWQIYNKIKHNRTTINNETKRPYFKLANQENVINSLAALFQLEMYYFRLVQQEHFPTESDIPTPPSALFVIDDWGNSWIAPGLDIMYQITEKVNSDEV